MDRILRVNMTDLTGTYEPFPEEWTFLGGRGLSARILLKEVDATCDPLGAGNKLIFAPGVLSGSAAPTSGRMSVGGKSPLTGTVKEANSGGQAGQKLMRLGIRALIVEGQAKDPAKRYRIDIDRNKVEISECPELKGMRTYAVSEHLAERCSERAAFVICGPAGEQRLTGASVAFTDVDKRHPSRHAARGGLGAVMGSKGLKVIVVDDEGTQARQPKDAEGYKTFVRNFTKEYMAGPQQMQYGTAVFTSVANGLHTLPTRNRREMQFEGVGTLDGTNILGNYATRGGSQHHCLSGCIVKCSNTVNDSAGQYVTSALEFETIALCGSNCGIADLDKVARIDRLCDELGLDTIETGAAIGLAMESGALPMGDADAVIALLESLDKGNDLAQTIGHGVVAVAKRFNALRVPAVRGQAIPAWEPRTLPVVGVTYATGAMGADHTAGLGLAPSEDPVRTSQDLQLINALVDSSGFCMFQGVCIENIHALYNGLFGGALTLEDVATLGWQCLEDEWEFSRRAGISLDKYDLPEWLRTEAIPSSGTVFAVPKDQLPRMFKRMPVNETMWKMTGSG